MMITQLRTCRLTVVSKNRMIPLGRCRFWFRQFATTNDESKSDDIVNVSIEEAKSTTTKALKQLGWDDEDASIQAEIMMSAEMCGNNQGLVKMYQPLLMAPSANAGKPIIEKETEISAVLNGNQAPGMLAAVHAADLATSKVKSQNSPISMVCTYNTSTSSGQLAFYVERMARQGLIGLALANSPEFVAAAPGGTPVFGTNPLAVAVPTNNANDPFVFDMATSAIALFGVLSAKAKNEPLPPNVAYGRDGTMTTDASEALDGGAIATFGGHKGAGLSLCVELLAGALSGAAVLGKVDSKRDSKNWGHTFIAIQPNSFVDNFPDRASSIIQTVKASGEGIRIPGENSSRIRKERRTTGELPIPKAIWESILNTANNGISTK